jgi:hypothetical protein
MSAIFAMAFCWFLTPHPAPGQVKDRVLTAEDFENDRVDRGSGKEERTFRIQISPDLPPYVFHLIPDLEGTDSPGSNNPRHHVGRIEISRGDPAEIIQTIRVKTHAEVSSFIQFFRASDINFDGYLDIAVLDDFGAKWGSLNYWVFDPPSGRFITNNLTRQIRALKHSQMRLDADLKTITAGFFYGTCPQSKTFQVVGQRLKLIKEDAHKCD